MKRRRETPPTAPPPPLPCPSPSLPILQKSSSILSALAANDILLILAETGSGKTTQVPQLILDSDGTSSIVITQPRRVAAITVATRVAKERGVQIGEEVGYAVRFEDRSKRGVTTIRYVTDGVLLREALTSGGGSGLKRRYSHVIIDEVHERSVNTDLLLGVVKQALTSVASESLAPVGKFARKNAGFAQLIRSRLPFKVVIMSATTDAAKIVNFFKTGTSLKVSTLRIEGRSFPVKTLHAAQPVGDYIDGVVSATLQVHNTEKMPGDILAFLPGQEEIMSAVTLLKENLKRNPPKVKLLVLPLYAALSAGDQMAAISELPDGQRGRLRKVIIATNIAETSITIPGIVYVIDSGLVKVKSLVYDKGVFADVLRTQALTVAQAQQRMGRAGRTGPGRLYRLYTEPEFYKFEQFPSAEILTSEGTGCMLKLVMLSEGVGQGGFEKFPLLDDVPRKIKVVGLETLIVLGGLDMKMGLTDVGRMLGRLPVGPMLGRCLLESLKIGCVDLMLDCAAVLSVEGGVFENGGGVGKRGEMKKMWKRFESGFGDHGMGVRALQGFCEISGKEGRLRFCREYYLNYRGLCKAERIRMQLDGVLKKGEYVSWGVENRYSGEIGKVLEEEGGDGLLGRCLVAGYFRHVARSVGNGQFVTIGYRGGEGGLMENGVEIHPGSSLRGVSNLGFLVYDQLVVTTKAYLRTCFRVEKEWLQQHCSHHFKKA